jgi:penicillin amidase
MLASDPQLAVTVPGPLYEVRLRGGAYDVRGVTIPGTPGFLIGRNVDLAWGATAAGGHDANLYAETLGGGTYRFRDGWRPLRVRQERILIKGEAPLEVAVRHTHHGPLVDPLLPPGDGRHLALAHVATRARTATVQALLAMARARTFAEFGAALADYHLPAAHFVVAARTGGVGYHLGASIPWTRRGLSNDVLPGAAGTEEWEELRPGEAPGPFLPVRLLPHAFPLARGTLASANNTSVGPWYPLDIGFRGRDTDRSLRLRELLGGTRKLTVADMEAIHRDMESPMPRTAIRVALGVYREELPPSPHLMLAEIYLSRWDGTMGLDPATWPLVATVAARLHRFANRMERPALAALYGPGPVGAAAMARRFTPLLARGEVPREPVARQALLELLEEAAAETVARMGPDERRWRLPPQAGVHPMPYQGGLLGLGSLDRAADLAPRFPCDHTATIRSPRGNCYSLLVEMGDPDHFWTLLPPGIAEDPASPHGRDQLADWQAGRLHRGWLRKDAVRRIATARTLLLPPP